MVEDGQFLTGEGSFVGEDSTGNLRRCIDDAAELTLVTPRDLDLGSLLGSFDGPTPARLLLEMDS